MTPLPARATPSRIRHQPRHLPLSTSWSRCSRPNSAISTNDKDVQFVWITGDCSDSASCSGHAIRDATSLAIYHYRRTGPRSRPNSAISTNDKDVQFVWITGDCSDSASPSGHAIKNTPPASPFTIIDELVPCSRPNSAISTNDKDVQFVWITGDCSDSASCSGHAIKNTPPAASSPLSTNWSHAAVQIPPSVPMTNMFQFVWITGDCSDSCSPRATPSRIRHQPLHRQRPFV